MSSLRDVNTCWATDLSLTSPLLIQGKAINGRIHSLMSRNGSKGIINNHLQSFVTGCIRSFNQEICLWTALHCGRGSSGGSHCCCQGRIRCQKFLLASNLEVNYLCTHLECQSFFDIFGRKQPNFHPKAPCGHVEGYTHKKQPHDVLRQWGGGDFGTKSFGTFCCNLSMLNNCWATHWLCRLLDSAQLVPWGQEIAYDLLWNVTPQIVITVWQIGLRTKLLNFNVN